jgi:glycosyltransferase involved in cell wall biosynthesis
MKERASDITLIISENSGIKDDIIANSLPYVEIKKPVKYYDFPKAKKISAYILKNNIEVLICGDNNDLNFASLVKMFCSNKIKLIYIQQMQIGINKKDLLHNMTHSRIDYWVTPLEYLKKQATEKTNVSEEKIRIIRYGTEVNKFTEMKEKIQARHILNIPENKFVIGILGRIDRLKGQDFLIESVNYIKEKHNLDFYLIIAGNPTKNEGEEFINELKERVKKFKLEKNISFTGRINDSADFYSAIDLFAMASQSESYGLVTIEAMLAGTPVIGTNTGGTPELLNYGEYGVIYKSGDIEDFAGKVIEIYNNYNVYLEKSRAARKNTMQEYSHQTECENLEKIIFGNS